MLHALHGALNKLASENLKPEALTLTREQYKALILDLSQLRILEAPLPVDGVLRYRAPWGEVRILRGDR